MKAALIWDPALSRYKFRPDHPFNPKRLELTVSLMEELGVIDPADHRVVTPRIATDEELLRVHSREFVEAVKAMSLPGARALEKRWGLGTDDTPIFPGVHDAAAAVWAGRSRQRSW